MNSSDPVQPPSARAETPDPRADVATWEATVMKDVATLLDSLEIARTEWEALNARLGQAQTRLHAAEGRAASAEQVASEIASLKKDVASAQSALASEREARVAAELERDEARAQLESERETRQRASSAATGELELVRQQAAEADDELERKAEELALAQRGREKANALASTLTSELDQLRAEFGTVRRERDLLAESGKDMASAAERIAATDREREEAEEFASKQQAEIQRLTTESEQNLVLICDLRSRINRIETQRDEATSTARRKTKKILRKIHESLDAVGAPAGEEMSYGERIRRLVDKLTGAAPLDLDDPFDEFDQI